MLSIFVAMAFAALQGAGTGALPDGPAPSPLPARPIPIARNSIVPVTVRLRGFGNIASLEFTFRGSVENRGSIAPWRVRLRVTELEDQTREFQLPYSAQLSVSEMHRNFIVGSIDIQLDARTLRPGNYLLGVEAQPGLYMRDGTEQPVEFLGPAARPFSVSMWSALASFDMRPRPGQHSFSLAQSTGSLPYGEYQIESVRPEPNGDTVLAFEQTDSEAIVAVSERHRPPMIRILRDPEVSRAGRNLVDTPLRATENVDVRCDDALGEHLVIRENEGRTFRIRQVYRVAHPLQVQFLAPARYGPFGILAIDPIFVDFDSVPVDAERSAFGASGSTESRPCTHAWAFFRDLDDVARAFVPLARPAERPAPN